MCWLSDTEKLLSYNPGAPPNPSGRPVSWQFPVCRQDPRVRKHKPPKASSTSPAARLAGSRNKHSSHPLLRQSGVVVAHWRY